MAIHNHYLEPLHHLFASLGVASSSKAIAVNDASEEESDDDDSNEEDDELSLITKMIKKDVEKQELLHV
ncbi:hypothetical protein JHK87_050387 [Glycine soja]|nr:hypothetical protein JHK87_050387 [Glycine soja]